MVGCCYDDFQVTLELGRSYLPLATAALDALEKWSALLPSEVIQPYYSHILPCLDPYLRTASQTGENKLSG